MEYTIEDLCSKFSLTQSALAAELGISNAQVSKVKLNKMPISDDLRFRVKMVFGNDVELINTSIRPQDYYYNRKEAYYELLEKYNAKIAENVKLQTENNELKKRLKNISEYAAGGMPFAGRRKKHHDE